MTVLKYWLFIDQAVTTLDSVYLMTVMEGAACSVGVVHPSGSLGITSTIFRICDIQSMCMFLSCDHYHYSDDLERL